MRAETVSGSALPIGIIELTIFVLYLVPKTRYVGGLLMLADWARRSLFFARQGERTAPPLEVVLLPLLVLLEHHKPQH